MLSQIISKLIVLFMLICIYNCTAGIGKKDRKRAFSKMREFNRRYHLEAHTDKKSARLISALDRGIAAYAVRALLFRLQRGS